MYLRGSQRNIDTASFVIDVDNKSVYKNRYGGSDKQELEDSIAKFIKRDNPKDLLSFVLIKSNQQTKFSFQELKIMFEMSQEENQLFFDSFC